MITITLFPTESVVPAYGCGRIASALCALILALSIGHPVLAASGTDGYEIPLGELHKVKKEQPARKARKAGKPGTATKAAEQKQERYQAVVIPEGQGAQEGKGATTAPVPTASENTLFSIHHDSYSYLVAGKRTVIQAVVSGSTVPKEVFCRFRAGDKGLPARVTMQPVPGTSFTFTTTIPALAATATDLRYSVVARDASGGESSSQEFVIPLKATSVIPGWQLESAADPVRIIRESADKPFEGFSDPGLSEEKTQKQP